MSKKLRTDAVDHLFDAILSLQNREAVSYTHLTLPTKLEV